MSYMNTVTPYSESALVGRNATVETDHVHSTGPISYIEGDIFEVELSKYDMYHPGDTAKIVIYAPGGILQFYTTIIGRDHGAIMLFIPFQIQQLLIRQRKYSRVEVDCEAAIDSITHPLHQEQTFDPPMNTAIKNVSLGGIGFHVNTPIDLKSLVHVELKLDTTYRFALEIIHCNELNGEFYSGGKFKHFPPEKLNSFHAFILKKQIEQRFESKKIEFEKQLNIQKVMHTEEIEN
jgi:c-di-GMP-binding flagellar brake protein YcgR